MVLGHWQTKAKWLADVETNFIPSTILGLLALVLGFTFSMAVSRYDTRRDQIVKEANSIGTAYLRAELMPDQYPEQLKSLIKHYLEVRIQFHAVKDDLIKDEEIAAHTAKFQTEIWKLMVDISRTHNTPITALTVAAMNEMFDAGSERTFASKNRIPELVFLLLFLVAGIGVASMGFMESVRNEKPFFNVVVLSVLFALVIGLILDIDRPQKGFIQTNQLPLLELRESLNQESR